MSRQVWPRRSVLIFAGACAAIAAALATVTVVVVSSRERAAALQPVSSTGEARVGGPFQLVDQDGRAVDHTLLNGRWSLVFFGFTYCPEACPNTLGTLAAIQSRMGAEAPQMVFVSIDPERDTPQLLKTYLSSSGFPEGVIGLTGTPEQVEAAAKAYRVSYEKVGEGDSYIYNHTLLVYLMGPDGKFRSVVGEELGPDRSVDVIRRAMARG